MIRYKLSFLLILFATIDTIAQIEVQLLFFNDCDSSIHELQFSLSKTDAPNDYFTSTNGIAVVNSPGSYILDATYIWGDNMYGSVFHTINIKKSESFIDTLRIPRIKFTWDGVLHSQYWNYFDCEQLCNGVHSDTYPNGSKRMEGRFENGKPSYITSFRIDGTKEMTEFYNLGKLEFERIEYFDRNGQLSEYEVHKNKKLKTITITYSAEGEKLGKEVTKHIIEK